MPACSTTANAEWNRCPLHVALILLFGGIILISGGFFPHWLTGSLNVLSHESAGQSHELFLKWSAMLFYPFTLLRFVSPVQAPWLYFDLFHCAVAVSGLYLLASRWTANRWLALALSLLIMPFASGEFLSANRMAALVWVPWMFLLAEPALARGGRDLVLCSGLAAIQLLAGSPEVVALTWVCLVLMPVGRTVPVSLAPSAWLPVKRLSAFALLAFLLAATQVVPLLDALPVLEKSRPSIDVDVEHLDSQGHCLV